MRSGDPRPLDEGLLNAFATMSFKRLADGRWACFAAFAGKAGRVLPSESAGRRIRRASAAGWFLAVAAFVVTGRLLGWAAGGGVFLAVTVATGLWVRRRLHPLPTTDETLSRSDGLYQARAMAWGGLMIVPFAFFLAGAMFGAYPHERLVTGVLVLSSFGLAAACLHHLNRATAARR